MAGINVSQDGWIEYDPQKKLYVSAQRMPSVTGYFSLKDALNMDTEFFNNQAKKYNVRPINEITPPIDRMVRMAVLLSRKGKDCSSLFPDEEYVEMVLKVAKAKKKGNEQLASFYEILTTSPMMDATLDVYKFMEKRPEGYIIDLLRFNEEGDLIKIDEGLKLPKEGWQVAISRHGIALETSPTYCHAFSLGDSVLDGKINGYLSIGKEPEKGEKRIVLRGPSWDSKGLLYTSVIGGLSASSDHVGALRMRREIPELIEAEKEVKRLRSEVRTLEERIFL